MYTGPYSHSIECYNLLLLCDLIYYFVIVYLISFCQVTFTLIPATSDNIGSLDGCCLFVYSQFSPYNYFYFAL